MTTLFPWASGAFNLPEASATSVYMTMTEDTPPYIDKRDSAVIETLTVGKVYGVTRLKKLYKLRTDIRNDRTAKERKNVLVKTPAFECVGIGKFRFVGVSDDE